MLSRAGASIWEVLPWQPVSRRIARPLEFRPAATLPPVRD
jgi:hypothetical protein